MQSDKFIYWQLTADQNLHDASYQGGWGTCFCTKNIKAIYSVAVGQTPNLLLKRLEPVCKYTVLWNHALTPWRLGGFGNFCKKNSSFWLPYQCPSSSADCARELFNGSKGSANLVDCTRKKKFAWGVRVFCDWCHKWSSFRVILAHVAWPRTQPLGLSVSLKFSLETRLEFESFEPLTDRLSSVFGSKVMI